jgi:hypothetical protein
MSTRLCILVAFAVLYMSPAAAVCSEFQSLENAKIVEFTETLKRVDAPPADRIAALENLAQARDPLLRRSALEVGIEASDRLVRAKAFAAIMMQKEAFEIVFVSSPGLSDESREWIKKQGGTAIYSAKFRDCVNNCIGIARKFCHKSYQIKIDGTRAEVFSGAIYGRFELQPDNNTMAGIIKPNPRAAEIRASFKLL